ncbi:MAG: universal stress protein, partial [Alphaproteobacteria bacterium]|nr:universal stress protein [Alphaproteobacteria bacterium]
IVAECEAVDAALLIMGGYTHNRLRQMIFGGVTAHVIRHATIPVLMGH